MERPVYIEAECPACPEPSPCAICPIVDCPVPEPCTPIFCPEPKTVICEPTECDECLCDEYCASQTEPVYIDFGEEVDVGTEDEEDNDSEHDEDYYDDEDSEDWIDEEYLCDSAVENCRSSKGDRNTDTYDENYNAYYYYGYYYDYGYFSPY